MEHDCAIKKRQPLYRLLLCVVCFKTIVSQPCNVKCDCTTPGIVTCHQKLTSFPVGLPGTTSSLSILGSPGSENSITTLKRSNLAVFPDLENLHISYSQLSSLDDDVFQDVTKLKRLYLRNNNIKQININIFQRTSGLFVLDFTGNRGCKISSNAFKSLNKLQSLFLGDLELGTASTDIFDGLNSLIELDLHGNDLQDFSVDVLNNMPKLRTLDLSYNNIASLPDLFLPIFKGLRYFDLSDNPWICICEIKWFKQLNSTLMYSTIAGSVPVCSSPYRLKYQPIYLIPDKDLSCIPPKILGCGDPYNVKPGNIIHITCTVEGNIFPDITWVRPDGGEIPVTGIPFSDPQYKITRDVSVPVHVAAIDDDGDWTIRAANNKGKDMKTFHVHVEVPTTTTTTTTTTTSSPEVEVADDFDIGFLIAAGGFGGTVLIGLIILVSVLCCVKQKKNRVTPDKTKEKWNEGKYVDEVTFVVAPVSS